MRQELALAYETLRGMGIFDYAGDVSVRLADGTFLIRAARVALGSATSGSRVRTTPDDILAVDLGGMVREGNGRPPIEVAIHGAVYAARADVGAVIHCHPKMVNVLTIAGHELRPVFVRGPEVIATGLRSTAHGDPITSAYEAAAAVAVLGDATACVLPAHGVIVVGATLQLACLGVVNLEQSAEMQFLASQVGTPRELSADSVAVRTRVNTDPAFVAAAWGYYTELTGQR